MTAEPMWDLVEEHFDDAVFLWSQWERALISPDYTLSDLASRDEPRMLANIDALVLAGAGAQQQLLEPALQSEQPHLVAPAAFALLSTGQAPAQKQVLEGLDQPEPTRRAVARALQVYEGGQLYRALRGLVSEAEPEVRAAALNVLTYHGQQPREPLWKLPTDDCPELAIAVLRAMRLDLKKSHQPLVLAALESSEPRLRDEGLLTGVALDLEPAWKLCRELGHNRDPDGKLALTCLAVAGDHYDHDALKTALQTPETAEATLWALGCGGRVFGATQCLAKLEDPELTALAGEAFIAITGMPLAEALPESPAVSANLDQLTVEEPPARPEDALPVLDAERINQWWDQNRQRFDDDTRYLHGQTYGRSAVLTALREQPLRRRHPIAVEWMLRSGGQQRVHTRALTGRQQRELAAL